MREIRKGSGVGSTKTGIGAVAALAAVALFVLTACAAEPTGDPAAPSPSDAQVSTVASGLEAPWSVAFHGETPLVSERDSARVLELDEAGEPREVAVIEGVSHGGEGGLLGIAVHDDYLYTYFTAEGENRIERYPITGDPGSLALDPAEVVLDGIPAARNHNGGRIAFGPDDMLYATTGDAGDTGLAQDLGSLAGKILRITPEGAVPGDNPFAGSYVYSYGHRNPQGLAWVEDGTLYASEFGQNTWDELNVIEAGGNYGWPDAEGIAEEEGFIDPVQQWEPGEASPSGIAIAGDSIYIASLRGERLREVPLGDPREATEHFVGEHGRIRDVVVAPDGALWFVTNNTDGRGDPGPDDDRIMRLDSVG